MGTCTLASVDVKIMPEKISSALMRGGLREGVRAGGAILASAPRNGFYLGAAADSCNGPKLPLVRGRGQLAVQSG